MFEDGPKISSLKEVREEMNEYIADLSDRLNKLNRSIFDNPELAFKEYHAHDTICVFLEELGFKPTRHAYGLETAFEVISGSEGRMINFNAEYDALPEMGHACGHNLIATSSVAGFLALAHAIDKFGIKGRAQLLGTPAEEDYGGKCDLVKAGAYSEVDISLMLHPTPEIRFRELGLLGSSGSGSLASYDIYCSYKGVSSHSCISPFEGINALDAAVAAYNNVSMLRQQIRPDERIHGTIFKAPKITNAIPDDTVVKYSVRSTTANRVKLLGKRVVNCFEAGALATGCKFEIKEDPMYADLRHNIPICEAFQAHMGQLGEKVGPVEPDLLIGSTDQGNVSYVVPALHALIGIPVKDDANNHTPGFTEAAGTTIAYERCLLGGKAMAMIGWQTLVDDQFYTQVMVDFERDKAKR